MAASAKDRVLGTVELFEAVLAKLDMSSLLVCQRVSKSAKAIIDHSAVLQQALFFKLAPESTGRTFGRDGLNPLITSRPQLFKDPGGVTLLIESHKDYDYTPEIVETRHCTFIIEEEDVHGSASKAQSWQRMHLLHEPHRIGRLRLRLNGQTAVAIQVEVAGNVTVGEMFRMVASQLDEGDERLESRRSYRLIKQAAEAAR